MKPLPITRPAPSFPYLSGFEGTQHFGHHTDNLATTEHDRRFESDFRLLEESGITRFRCCIPWHRIERVPGTYDWSFTDQYLSAVAATRLTPIVDPVHHTSFPEWLQDGFGNDRFPDHYQAFMRAFAARYPWIKEYTIINEPFATSVLSGITGDWYPYWRDPMRHRRILINMARAIYRISGDLIARVADVRLVHVDACERHEAIDDVSRPHAEYWNQLRFLLLDLLSGKVGSTHPFYDCLTSEHLLTEAELAHLETRPARIDVLGLDYYPHSELGWDRHGRSEDCSVWGFCRVALEYSERYNFPVMLGETNVRGRIEDRISWLKYMVQECETLAHQLSAEGKQFLGFCWYPFIDSTDWDSLVREPRRSIDPQGIYWLDSAFNRQPSELSECYRKLALGEMSGADLPAYHFEAAVLDGRGVRKFLPHMNNWTWQTGEPSQPVAAA